MPKRKHELSLMEIFKDYSPVQMSNGQIRMECPFRENHADGSGRIFHKVKKDGTMSKVNHYIFGNVISIHKI